MNIASAILGWCAIDLNITAMQLIIARYEVCRNYENYGSNILGVLVLLKKLPPKGFRISNVRKLTKAITRKHPRHELTCSNLGVDGIHCCSLGDTSCTTRWRRHFYKGSPLWGWGVVGDSHRNTPLRKSVDHEKTRTLNRQSKHDLNKDQTSIFAKKTHFCAYFPSRVPPYLEMLGWQHLFRIRVSQGAIAVAILIGRPIKSFDHVTPKEESSSCSALSLGFTLHFLAECSCLSLSLLISETFCSMLPLQPQAGH